MRFFDLLPHDRDAWETSRFRLPWGAMVGVAIRSTAIALASVLPLALPTWVGIPLSIALAVLVIRASLMLDHPEPALRQVRWERLRLHRPRGNMGQWLLATAVCIIGMFASSMATMCFADTSIQDPGFFEKLLPQRDGALLLTIVVGLLTPFIEEFVFRGWSYPMLSGAGGKKFAFILSSSIWALLHLNLARYPDLMLSAAAYHLALAATGSLWSCVALHVVNNSSAIILGHLFRDAEGEPPSSLTAFFVYLGVTAICGVVFVWLMRRIAKTKKAGDSTDGTPTPVELAASPQ